MTSPIKVVDALAFVALLFQEPDAAAVLKQLQGAQLIAPTLLDYELMNVCLNKIRRDPPSRPNLLYAFASRNRIAVQRLEVDADDVLNLAEVTKLTAYDASYLWLARTCNADLVTLDKRLQAAAVTK